MKTFSKLKDEAFRKRKPTPKIIDFKRVTMSPLTTNYNTVLIERKSFEIKNIAEHKRYRQTSFYKKKNNRHDMDSQIENKVENKWKVSIPNSVRTESKLKRVKPGIRNKPLLPKAMLVCL